MTTFQERFDSPLGEVDYRISRYHSAVDDEIRIEARDDADATVAAQHEVYSRRSTNCCSSSSGFGTGIAGTL